MLTGEVDSYGAVSTPRARERKSAAEMVRGGRRGRKIVEGRGGSWPEPWPELCSENNRGESGLRGKKREKELEKI